MENKKFNTIALIELILRTMGLVMIILLFFAINLKNLAEGIFDYRRVIVDILSLLGVILSIGNIIYLHRIYNKEKKTE